VNAIGEKPLAIGLAAPKRVVNAMTVDVEDYFQVQAFANCVSRAEWDLRACRVEANTDRILNHFDGAGIRATFFTLGWVAARYPALIRRIVDAGHELASHGWEHVLVHDQDAKTFAADIGRTRKLLEDVGGTPVTGYRAATFSIGSRTPWAFDKLAEQGYRYSSSIYPVKHDLYGMPDSPRTPYRPGDGAVWEIPMTALRVMGQNLPCSGGGYFRLLPYPVYRLALSQVNRREQRSGIFYFHPWEIDPGQPRIGGASRLSRFRHYVNLAKTADRLDHLLRDFAWDRMDAVFADILHPGSATAA
jgi:polysaccharide deacetylase family protein (PEP-CTERM system associated)